MNRLRTHVLLGAGLALTLASAPASAQEKVSLRPKALRNWDLVLPAPQSRDVAGGITVAGTTFAALSEGDVLRADLDADGELEAILEGETGFLALRGNRADGSEFRYFARLDKQPFQPWTWTTGGAMVGEISGTPVMFLDQNLDGDVTDVGVDAMVVGQDHAASFLSRVVSVNGSLYAIELDAAGASLSWRPYQGPAGKLDLLANFQSKAKLDAAIVVNADASLSFSLARADGGLTVPVGEYRLHSGRLALGDSSAQISAGSGKAILVAGGAAAAPAWGGPVRAEFAVQRRGAEVAFAPWDIWFYGSLGEEYSNFLPLGESPMFTIKERGTGEPLVYARFPGNC